MSNTSLSAGPFISSSIWAWCFASIRVKCAALFALQKFFPIKATTRNFNCVVILATPVNESGSAPKHQSPFIKPCFTEAGVVSIQFSNAILKHVHLNDIYNLFIIYRLCAVSSRWMASGGRGSTTRASRTWSRCKGRAGASGASRPWTTWPRLPTGLCSEPTSKASTPPTRASSGATRPKTFQDADRCEREGGRRSRINLHSKTNDILKLVFDVYPRGVFLSPTAFTVLRRPHSHSNSWSRFSFLSNLLFYWLDKPKGNFLDIPPSHSL